MVEHDYSRRDQGNVRLIAMLDMILSFVLFGFYLSIAFTKTIVFQVPKGPFSKPALVVISLIIWIVVFAVTYLQLSTAYRLFVVTFQDALGPRAAVDRSLAWLRLTLLIAVFYTFKIIFCWLRFEKLVWFFWVLCVIEFIIRFIGVFFVREFCDDLKHHIRLTTMSPNTSKNCKDPTQIPKVVVVNANHIEDV